MKTSRDVVEKTEMRCHGCELLITYTCGDFRNIKCTDGRRVYGIVCPDCDTVYSTIALSTMRNKKGFWARLFNWL